MALHKSKLLLLLELRPILPAVTPLALLALWLAFPAVTSQHCYDAPDLCTPWKNFQYSENKNPYSAQIFHTSIFLAAPSTAESVKKKKKKKSETYPSGNIRVF